MLRSMLGMTGRRHLWAASGLALVLAGCGGPGATGVDRIAYIGADGHLYTSRGDGSNAVAMTQDRLQDLAASGMSRVENWPTWSPDGKHIAFMRVRLSGGSVDSSGIVVVDSDGKSESVLPTADRSAPVYMSWSPDSQYLTMLVQQGPELRLEVADFGHDQPIVQNVEGGSSMYTSWSPDSSELLIHADGDLRDTPNARLELMNVRAGTNPEKLPIQPGSFLTPAWAPDGSEWAFAAAISGTEDGVYLRRGSRSTLLAQGGVPAFEWAPADDRLALTMQASSDDTFYTGLSVIGAEGKASRVWSDKLLAFFWSPDGRRLACFTPAGEDTVGLSVIDADGRNRRDLAVFSPSDEFGQLLTYADQYGQSHSIWAPDARSVLVTGSLAGESGAHIYSVPVDGSKVTRIADGSIGFWSFPRR